MNYKITNYGYHLTVVSSTDGPEKDLYQVRDEWNWYGIYTFKSCTVSQDLCTKNLCDKREGSYRKWKKKKVIQIKQKEKFKK